MNNRFYSNGKSIVIVIARYADPFDNGASKEIALKITSRGNISMEAMETVKNFDPVEATDIANFLNERGIPFADVILNSELSEDLSEKFREEIAEAEREVMDSVKLFERSQAEYVKKEASWRKRVDEAEEAKRKAEDVLQKSKAANEQALSIKEDELNEAHKEELHRINEDFDEKIKKLHASVKVDNEKTDFLHKEALAAKDVEIKKAIDRAKEAERKLESFEIAMKKKLESTEKAFEAAKKAADDVRKEVDEANRKSELTNEANVHLSDTNEALKKLNEKQADRIEMLEGELGVKEAIIMSYEVAEKAENPFLEAIEAMDTIPDLVELDDSVEEAIAAADEAEKFASAANDFVEIAAGFTGDFPSAKTSLDLEMAPATAQKCIEPPVQKQTFRFATSDSVFEVESGLEKSHCVEINSEDPMQTIINVGSLGVRVTATKKPQPDYRDMRK